MDFWDGFNFHAGKAAFGLCVMVAIMVVAIVCVAVQELWCWARNRWRAINAKHKCEMQALNERYEREIREDAERQRFHEWHG